MEQPMESFINWEDGETFDVANIDFVLFDSMFPPPRSPVLPPSPTFSLIEHLSEEAMKVEDVPELISGDELAPHSVPVDEITALRTLVNELVERVKTVENELHQEQERVEALERYVNELEPYLSHLGSTIEGAVVEDGE